MEPRQGDKGMFLRGLYSQAVFHCMENISLFFTLSGACFRSATSETPMACDLLLPGGVVSSDQSQFD